ncbi:MAG TPA: hypothetical protein VFS56_02000 [Gemmatimonadaceae bacterium]|nr:hypothetical protein [Gemmatimonadaceae bacterium]
MFTRLALAAFAATLADSPAFAQPGSPNTTPGTVSRVVLLDIKPGRANAFWADMRQNWKPLWDEQKRQGLLVDYSVATKTTTEGADDWDVLVTLTYANWAAFDTFGSRAAPITLRHYGSAARRDSATMARIENATTAGNFLVRDQTLNPWR